MADKADEEQREKLKASLWYAIGKMVDEECLAHKYNSTPQFIGAMTEMAWSQLETVATDLESFANHAGRNTVTPDDVLLITRRNDDLHDIMKDFIDKEKVNQGAKAKGKGKK